MDRREFLKAASAGFLFTGPFQHLASAQQKKVKITDVKCMIVRGTWDWNLIKIETDSGLYGIGEAYWGWGVKDMVLNKMKPIVVGEDPLNVDKLYTKMLMQSAGAGAIGGVTVTAASGIEIALWDLCGRILRNARLQSAGRPFPRPRALLSHAADRSRNVEDPVAVERAGASGARRKMGLDGVQVSGRRRPREGRSQFPGARPRPLRPRPDQQGLPPHRRRHGDGARDARARRRFRHRMPLALRHAGRHPPGARAGARCKPMWLEDPVPPDNIEAMAARHAIRSPSRSAPARTSILRQGFRKLIEMQAASGVHIDMPKSGGLLESKRISDLADLYYIWTACHNPASPVGTIASVPCRRVHARFPHSRAGELGGLVARPGDPRRAVLEERLFHYSGQARLGSGDQSGRGEGASGAGRDLVG